MNNIKTSQQKAQLVGFVRENKNEKNDRIVVKYKRLDSEDTAKEYSAQKWTASFSDEEKSLLKALKTGETFTLIKESVIGKGQDGTLRTFWNLKEIKPASAYVEKTKNYSKSGTSGYDNLGQQIGNAITNSIASLGAGKTMEQYKQRAADLMQMGNWLRSQMSKNINAIEETSGTVVDVSQKSSNLTLDDVLPEAVSEDDTWDDLLKDMEL